MKLLYHSLVFRLGNVIVFGVKQLNMSVEYKEYS
jgi:hypothetical protein